MKELQAFMQLGLEVNLWHWRWAEILGLVSGSTRQAEASWLREPVRGVRRGVSRLARDGMLDPLRWPRRASGPSEPAPRGWWGLQSPGSGRGHSGHACTAAAPPRRVGVPRSGDTSRPCLATRERVARKKTKGKGTGSAFALSTTRSSAPPAGLRPIT